VKQQWIPWYVMAAAALSLPLALPSLLLVHPVMGSLDDGTATFAGRDGFTALAVGLLWTTVAAVRLLRHLPS
jgi:hypothetical protein